MECRSFQNEALLVCPAQGAHLYLCLGKGWQPRALHRALFLRNSSVYANSLLLGEEAALPSGTWFTMAVSVLRGLCRGKLLIAMEKCLLLLQEQWPEQNFRGRPTGPRGSTQLKLKLLRYARSAGKRVYQTAMLRPALCKSVVLIYSPPAPLSVPFCGSEGHEDPTPFFY